MTAYHQIHSVSAKALGLESQPGLVASWTSEQTAQSTAGGVHDSGRYPVRYALWSGLLCVALVACSAKGNDSKPPPLTRSDFVGVWRVVFDSPGGELPIEVEIFDESSDKPAVFRNGAQEIPFSEVSLVGPRINLRVDHRDAAITAELDNSRKRLIGTWQVLEQDGPSTLPVVAYKGQTHRFAASPGGMHGAVERVPSVAGTWKLDFKSDEGGHGIAELAQQGDVVTGTIIHPIGSLRYLTGQYQNGVLHLSSFNGGVASLVRARGRDDGTLSGDIWYNDDGYLGFSATRSTPDEARKSMRDPATLVRVLEPTRPVSFQFPDLDGQVISHNDPRFEGKAMVIELFGSWCSNCNDAAALMVAWHKRYRSRGLEILGLAYEHTGELERDRRQVRRFAKHHGIEFPLLLAGTSDLRKPLADLSEVDIFPTMLFIGRDGLVRKVHTGFLGPSAGVHYERQIAQLEADIEKLLEP